MPVINEIMDSMFPGEVNYLQFTIAPALMT